MPPRGWSRWCTRAASRSGGDGDDVDHGRDPLDAVRRAAGRFHVVSGDVEMAAIRKLDLEHVSDFTGYRTGCLYLVKKFRDSPEEYSSHVSVSLGRLRAASAAVDRADEQRAQRIARRDAAIADAFAAGATWAQVQEATGLSPRGVQLAIRRHNASQG